MKERRHKAVHTVRFHLWDSGIQKLHYEERHMNGVYLRVMKVGELSGVIEISYIDYPSIWMYQNKLSYSLCTKNPPIILTLHVIKGRCSFCVKEDNEYTNHQHLLRIILWAPRKHNYWKVLKRHFKTEKDIRKIIYHRASLKNTLTLLQSTCKWVWKSSQTSKDKILKRKTKCLSS